VDEMSLPSVQYSRIIVAIELISLAVPNTALLLGQTHCY